MLHSWNLSPKQAVALQKQMASRVILKPLPEEITVVAGADVGYSRGHDRAVAAGPISRKVLVSLRTRPSLLSGNTVAFGGV
jgi:deoxyinosine 3'endonuclease (endonuclease V)